DCADHACPRATADLGGHPRPAWSPDGARIAASDDGPAYIIDASSMAATPIALAGWDKLRNVRWSPSGASLLFEETKSSGVDGGVMCIDGSCRRDGLAQGQANVSTESWAPNGARLAALVNPSSHLLTLCPDGSCKTDLGETTGYLWSKDGDYIYHTRR